MPRSEVTEDIESFAFKHRDFTNDAFRERIYDVKNSVISDAQLPGFWLSPFAPHIAFRIMGKV